jgi:hypothetical protein
MISRTWLFPVYGVRAASVAAGISTLCLMGLTVAPARGAVREGAGLCPRSKRHDYSAPLRAFPPIQQLPRNGVVPFGPPRTAIYSLSEDVLAGEGAVGFRIDLPRSPRRHRLGWTIDFRAARVSARGSVRETIATRRVHLQHSRESGREETKVSALVPRGPAFYRLDISIRNPHRATLGHYSQYVRAVSPTIKVKLALASDTFSPGDPLLTRIENKGTVRVVYEPHLLSLEQWINSGWTSVTDASAPSSGAAKVGLIPAGHAGECRGLRLPSGLTPGLYRMSQVVSAGSKRFTLHAPFHVR